MVAGDDMPRLLPAETIPGCQHLLQHVAVTDTRLHGPDTRLAHRDQQAQVAHDGHDQRVLREGTAATRVHGQSTHDLVAVNEMTLVVDSQTPIRIPVVRDTEVASRLHHRCLQSFGVSRTGIQVDVASVRGRIDDSDVRAEFTEHSRSKLVRSAIRAVNGDLHATQVRANRLNQVFKVGLASPRVVRINVPHGSASRTIPLHAHERLDLVLNRIGELVATVSEELDAVVLHRIMRRRNHDTQVHSVLGGCQMRDGRRGNNTNTRHIHASARQTRRKSMVKELARNTRITTNDRPWLRTVRSRPPTELAGSCLAKLQREFRCNVNVRQSSHAIRAEHPGHSFSVQWVIRLH